MPDARSLPARRTARSFLRPLLPAAGALLFAACIGEPEAVPNRNRIPTHPQPKPTEALRGLTITPNNLDLVVGDSVTIIPSPIAAAAEIIVQCSYILSDSSTVRITRIGEVATTTALRPGETLLTVSCWGHATGFSTNTKSVGVPVTVRANGQ